MLVGIIVAKIDCSLGLYVVLAILDFLFKLFFKF